MRAEVVRTASQYEPSEQARHVLKDVLVYSFNSRKRWVWVQGIYNIVGESKDVSLFLPFSFSFLFRVGMGEGSIVLRPCSDFHVLSRFCWGW